jgi:hypothetical protein
MKSLWGRPSGDDERDDQVVTPASDRPDPRKRPPDPAGTQPKYDPRELRPHTHEPLLASPPPPPIDVDHEEETGDGELLPERAAPAAVGAPPHSARFQFALGALIACALAGLAAAAVILARGGEQGAPSAAVTNWSSWQPAASGKSPPTQIAEHVGREYRMPDGAQLALATGGAMQIQGLPLYPALRGTNGDIEVVEGDGVLFRLCGLGPQCTIPKSKPSQERHLLLRREALELALYSFRYLDADYAVVFLPPAFAPNSDEPVSQALYVPRDEVKAALGKPLNATLADRTPTVSNVTQSPDAQFVQNVTMRQLFRIETFTQGNFDDRAFVVLDRMGG